MPAFPDYTVGAVRARRLSVREQQTMKLGFIFVGTETIRQIAAITRRAEERGFASAYVAEAWRSASARERDGSPLWVFGSVLSLKSMGTLIQTLTG